MSIKIFELLNNSLRYFQDKNFLEAKRSLGQVLEIEPENFDALRIMGAISGAENNYQQAIDYFNKTIFLNPKYTESYFNKGLALFKLNKLEEAIICYDKAIQLNPNFFQALCGKGIVLNKLNRYHEAIENYNKAIQLKPDYAEAWSNKGLTLDDLKQYEEALNHYDKAIQLEPDYAEAWSNKGITLHNLNRYEEALNHYDKAIQLKPDYAEAWSNKGLTLDDLKQYEEALNHYDKAIQLEPDYAEAWSNKGITLHNLNRYEEALNHYDKAIQLKPDYAEAWSNKGITLHNLNRYEEALNHYDKAIELNSIYADAHFGKSLIKIQTGDFKEGWKFYDYRFKTFEVMEPLYDLNKNLWDGKFLNGTLLVWSEQGIGDHLFYGRMVQCLRNKAKKIIFIVDKRLINLFKNFFSNIGINNIEIIEKNLNKPYINFEKHIPAGSLGNFFANSEKEILNFSKNSFVIDNSKDYTKISKFLNNLNGFKVGLSWKTLNKKEQYRNIPLEKLISIFKNKNCSLINLQFGFTIKEIQEAEESSSIKIHSLKEMDIFNDIDELSFLINNLDLLITIQNTTAHLSLVFQKKTFVLLPTNSRWQWGLGGEKSIWYPAAHIFRQSKFNNWIDVLKKVKISLDRFFV